MNNSSNKVKLGPEPTLLSRKEVDALYETLEAVKTALDKLNVDYIVTGGSLLGAIRQHSILFCDDDIDIAIIDYEYYEEEEGEEEEVQEGKGKGGGIYKTKVLPNLQNYLGNDYIYQIKPWDGGDRIRPKRMNNIFLDLFVLRKYNTSNDLIKVIGKKKNGKNQSSQYIQSILTKMEESAVVTTATTTTTTTTTTTRTKRTTTTTSQPSSSSSSSLWPCWQFTTRKAIEMWTREVYRENELFPLINNLKMGPVTNIKGPQKPIRLLKRAFGNDCFDVYYQSTSHRGDNNNNNKKKSTTTTTTTTKDNGNVTTTTTNNNSDDLPPLVSAGGTWEGSQKVQLTDEQYLPMQPISRVKRRPTLHCKERLLEYIQEQTKREEVEEADDYDNGDDGNGDGEEEVVVVVDSSSSSSLSRPRRTVYMDGVFDLFHIGHLEAIKQCSILGDKVIIGVTGDVDATGYKRPPIVPEKERVAIIDALGIVDKVVCPCPLIVTQSFMDKYSIDLVVHGFANDNDAERQREFFEVPMKQGKFQRISYYNGLSTTERINNIQEMTKTTMERQNEQQEQQQQEQNLTSSFVFESNKPQWFGFTLAAATQHSSTIPIDPFPLFLRQVIEPHIEKARTGRRDALAAIRQATGETTYDSTMELFKQSSLAKEGDLVSPGRVLELRSALLEAGGLLRLEEGDTFDLSQIHCSQGSKDKLLCDLTKNFSSFQSTYDDFVRSVCAPVMAKLYDCNEIYYQAFPCLRIIQPGEFSIGPHSDVAYGHHPSSVNFYVPLTKIGDTSALFLESRSGSEDWHPIEGDIGKLLSLAYYLLFCALVMELFASF